MKWLLKSFQELNKMEPLPLIVIPLLGNLEEEGEEEEEEEEEEEMGFNHSPFH